MSADDRDAWVNEVRLWFYGGTPPHDQAEEEAALLGAEAATGALTPPLLTITLPSRKPVPRLPREG
jgi:hypothetical protein